VTRSTSTDGLTSSDHTEASVSHSDVSSTATTVYYNAASSKPVRILPVILSWFHYWKFEIISISPDPGSGTMSVCQRPVRNFFWWRFTQAVLEKRL